MRALLIDAVLRKVIEFDFDNNRDGIKDLLDLKCRGGVTVASGPLIKPNDEPDDAGKTVLADYLYARDVFAQYRTQDYLPGALREDDLPTIKGDPGHWFQIDAHLDEPTTFPIPNRGIVVGVDYDGRWVDASISLQELAARVTFSRRKLRGTTTRNTIMPGETWIGPWASIIDEM
jgi:hypothetical protein